MTSDRQDRQCEPGQLKSHLMQPYTQGHAQVNGTVGLPQAPGHEHIGEITLNLTTLTRCITIFQVLN